jgi:tRNA pseudouridine38-40 synthase
MLLAYDGTAYQGWQVQAEGDTIQGRLEDALGRMAKSPVRVTAAGRTDAGVHALGQVAHFRLEHEIPEDGILRGLNTLLPLDIRVRAVEQAPPDFHARYRARSKTYRYHLERASVPLPFRSRFAVHYPRALDEGALDEAARAFEGEHDFAAFRASSCNAKTTTRRVFASSWSECGTELVFEVTATGFLQHMIRNMVGTMLEIGGGKRPLASISALFASGERTAAGPTAKAKGLHLVRVDYPD